MQDEGNETPADTRRCPHCDSVIEPGSESCLMCGASVLELTSPDEPSEISPAERARGEGDIATKEDESTRVPSASARDTTRAETTADGVIDSIMRERQSRIVFWMTGFVFLVTALLGGLVLRYGGPVQLALVPTATPLPATTTPTASATLPPQASGEEVTEPVATATNTATPTLQPPRLHQVAEGETLFGLALFYGVSMESIASLNDFAVDTPIQSGQALEVPWPTATPPLEPILVEINGEPVIADPTNCERYEIQEGDAISVIAARYNIDFELLQQVNRLNENVILRPGDTICIPEITYGDVLPPTPGPSPTPSPTSFPPGPTLLYPPADAVIERGDEPVLLQWVAVKDLGPDEWYMVELEDLETGATHPHRSFTRDNALRVPEAWRPPVADYHEFSWQVSIVRVSGRRADGGFIYTFGGRESEPGFFVWKGAVPTATPTMTPTSTATPTP